MYRVAPQTNIVITGGGLPSAQLNDPVMRLLTYRTGGQVLPIAQSHLPQLFIEYAASMKYAQLIYARIIAANGPTTSTHVVRALVYSPTTLPYRFQSTPPSINFSLPSPATIRN